MPVSGAARVIHSYLTEHEGPHPAAPYRYSTYLSTAPVELAHGASSIAAVRGVGKPLRVRHHVLDYPAVPSDPQQGVDFVTERYRQCDRCHLSSSRMRVCMLKGNPYATVVFVGEGPGKKENMRGEVFCGPSGVLEDELCREVGIDPHRDIAWLNLVGCRPTKDGEDRPPSLIEKAACSERTLGLLQAIRPRVVVCLGAHATSMFWGEPPNPNTWHTLRPRDYPDDWVVVGVARHPAYLLRSVMTRYQEYFAAKLFLRRLKRRLPTLTKTNGWRFGLRYTREFDGPAWDSHDPRR